MDSYRTPEASEELIGDPAEHRHYGLVLKMVLWGEERALIYRRMEVNGITGPAADRLS